MSRVVACALLISLGASCARPPPSPHKTPAPDVAPAPRVVTPDATSPPDVPVERVCAAWAPLGRGVTVRRCTGAQGHAAVLLAGWNITTPSTEAWADALDALRLRALGVSTLYAVRGPEHVDFRGKELAVDALLADLDANLTAPSAWALVVAHSSGAHVAATLFDRAFRSSPRPSLRGRAVYVNLDGDPGIARDPERHLSPESVAGLRHIVFVAVEDRARGLRGFSHAAMTDGHDAFPRASELYVYDASSACCASDACAHLALIHRRPYARGNESYTRFDRAPVNTAWLPLAERWLTPP